MPDASTPTSLVLSSPLLLVFQASSSEVELEADGRLTLLASCLPALLLSAPSLGSLAGAFRFEGLSCCEGSLSLLSSSSLGVILSALLNCFPGIVGSHRVTRSLSRLQSCKGAAHHFRKVKCESSSEKQGPRGRCEKLWPRSECSARDGCHHRMDSKVNPLGHFSLLGHTSMVK